MVRNIPPYKAPGQDELQGIFHHKYWHIIGEDVFYFVKKCFETNSMPMDINKTHIALIPKCDSPDNMKKFRPISLCNISYKIITKLIVARLRPLLSKIIGPFQSSFIPRGTTTDNIIITQEIV